MHNRRCHTNISTPSPDRQEPAADTKNDTVRDGNIPVLANYLDNEVVRLEAVFQKYRDQWAAEHVVVRPPRDGMNQ